MSLAKRLSVVEPENSYRRCGTCTWLEELPPEDRAAFMDWIASDRSLTQLWHIAAPERVMRLMRRYITDWKADDE